MRRLFVVTFCLLALQANAQQADTAKVKKTWTHNVVGGLNLTQVSFNDNWAQGGENALAYALSLIGKSANDLAKTNWTNSYKFAFGQTKLGDQGVRKTDDKIDVESNLTFKVGTYINPYIAATLKTQFASGFDYGTQPKTEVSKFFDPAYLTQSAGLGYQPIPQIKTRLGAALREVVTGKLELFDAFKNFDMIIMRSDNTLAAKVSKYVTVNFNVQMLKEPPVRRGKIQAKETLAIGLSYTFL
jgi:hypothetical protein